jgi:hypothetical protein
MVAGLTDYRWTAADMLRLDMWSEAKAAGDDANDPADTTVV